MKGLSTRPSDCEIRISLKAGDLDIVSEGWEGEYTADSSYHQGRPVLHTGLEALSSKKKVYIHGTCVFIFVRPVR